MNEQIMRPVPGSLSHLRVVARVWTAVSVVSLSICVAQDVVSPQQLGQYMDNLASKNAATRVQAVRSIASLGAAAKPAVPALAAHLISDSESWQVKQYAAQALAKIGGGAIEAIPQVALASADRYPAVREQAVIALGAILTDSSEERTISVAVKALLARREDQVEVRNAARMSVAQIGDGAIPHLIDALLASGETSTRRFAADILATSEHLTLTGALKILPALHDPDAELRHSSGQALVRATLACAGKGRFCIDQGPSIKSIRDALDSNSDPLLQQYGRTAALCLDYLDLLSKTPESRLAEKFIWSWAPYWFIAAVISVCLLLFTALWRRASLRERDEQIRTLNEGIQSLSEAKAAQEQNDLARSILKRFVTMPGRESRPGFTIASEFRDSTSVSGDFYSWFSRTDGSVCVYLVDVEDNGIDAAIQATHAANVLERTLTRGDIESPDALLENADRAMHDELRQPNIAVTMNLVEIYPELIRLANAGMPAPLLFRYGQAQPQPLQAAGVYVGAGYSRFAVNPRIAESRTGDGDILVLFSDGVVEAAKQDGTIFGRAGIESAVARVRDQEPDVIARTILEAAAGHAGSATPNDDQTVVVVRFGPYQPLMAGAHTLAVVRLDETEAEFTVINSSDTAEVCDQKLRCQISKWLTQHKIPEPFAKRVWCAVWEALMNAVVYGSYRGDVISLTIRSAKESIVVEVEQPFEWRDWDKHLGSARKAALSVPPAEQLTDLGTATLLLLADKVMASRQGRLLTLVFEDRKERIQGSGAL